MGNIDHWCKAGTPYLLTYPALESSREILFIVSGAKKQQILSRVLANDPTLPAARLETGRIIRIFADQEAMGN